MPSGTAGSIRTRIVVAVIASIAVLLAALVAPGVAGPKKQRVSPVPKADCGPGARPEARRQGRVPTAHHESGRAARGYRCNTKPLGRFGATGGFKVHRYRDARGQVCAFYDSTRTFPTDLPENTASGDGAGVIVLDMKNPRKPRRTANLTTPAMLSPHESLVLNERRGLLVASLGNIGTLPGVLDVYSVKENCRRPRLLSSSPVAVLGHESGITPDGRTYYATSSFGMTLTAVSLDNPALPVPLYVGNFNYHGVRTSKNGRVLYAANFGNQSENQRLANGGLEVLDVSQIQDRVPNPTVRRLSALEWRPGSIPQAGDPLVIKGKKYLLESDEFSNNAVIDVARYDPSAKVGAARLIRIDNPRKPRVVSNLRLQVHQQWARRGAQANDPGVSTAIDGYASHYCSAPRRRNPILVACSMINSGLRVFDVRNPRRPKEVAYYNVPTADGSAALSAPAWDARTNSIWYTDGNSGFHAVQLTNGISFKRKR